MNKKITGRTTVMVQFSLVKKMTKISASKQTMTTNKVYYYQKMMKKIWHLISYCTLQGNF